MAEDMGSRIYKKRKEHNMTMEELGNKVGVNKTAVNKWEKGIVKTLKQSTIAKIAEALDCDPVWLMFGMDFSPEQGKQDADIIMKFHALNEANQTAVLTMIDSLLATQQ